MRPPEALLPGVIVLAYAVVIIIEVRSFSNILTIDVYDLIGHIVELVIGVRSTVLSQNRF